MVNMTEDPLSIPTINLGTVPPPPRVAKKSESQAHNSQQMLEKHVTHQSVPFFKTIPLLAIIHINCKDISNSASSPEKRVLL
jgi:hypothetical protein